MKATELRIGNLVSFYKSDVKEIMTDKITEICEYDGKYFAIIPKYSKKTGINIDKGIMGIFLTKEWLKKLGFEKENKYWCKKEWEILWSIHVSIKGGVELQLVRDDDFESNGTEIINLQRGCKYVHQLQNLYFALTGEELITK